MLVGLFLRTYRFHDWLDFGSDQVNDAERVGAVVEQTAPWPSYGPDMGNSGTGGRQNRFRLGPIYYDFEIVSAKLFGNNPDSMAYPDLLFSVLSIPLLYLFLRKAFNENVSLALTGLSTISFSSLSFSHSAWNVNPIPFFSLLFLLSLYEFVLGAEKTPFRWVVALGVALGVGIQLHAILLVLFPATLFFTSLLFLRKRRASWKKLVAVIFIMILLNLGQLFGEMNNDFKNTRIFLASATESSTASDERLSIRIGNELSCTFQADTYILSSVGPTYCDFSLMNAVKQRFDTETSGPIKNRRFLFETILCVLFSVAGFGCGGEEDPRVFEVVVHFSEELPQIQEDHDENHCHEFFPGCASFPQEKERREEEGCRKEYEQYRMQLDTDAECDAECDHPSEGCLFRAEDKLVEGEQK